MRIVTILVGGALASAVPATAKSPPTPGDLQLEAAEALVSAFYSFDPARLRAAMADAPASRPKLLFYQGWAEGGNYRIVDRHTCRHDKPGEVVCAVKVKDDLIAALGTGFDVTDTFHISFTGPRITAVRNSSDDPPEFEQALQWLGKTRPEILDGPCTGFFDGGLTPGDCVRAVVKGFAEWKTSGRPNSK